MSKKNLQIHSQNILPIIKQWLYSDKDIFLRELISNACDAMSKLSILRDQENLQISDDEFRVDIQIDKENKRLLISDTGIGMSAEEVEKYIAQLAFSGAEEFVEKYQQGDQNSQIIGHFGLGFYSSFMVSKTVEIETLSYREGSKAAHWSCDGGAEYELKEGTRETRGTTIILNLQDQDLEYLEEAKLKSILNKHCLFLPFPLYLGETRINEKEPLWIKNPSDLTDNDYIEFYRYLYPMDEDPIFWIHLNVDYPFHLQGILYFPKMKRHPDVNQNHVHLYCNRVFVSDQCKEILPEYLTLLKGVIDSPDIPLNVSRSYLQTDKTVRQLSTHIAKKVADKLVKTASADRDSFLEKWSDLEFLIKLGTLHDEKFHEKVAPALFFQTTEGTWMNIEEYIAKNKELTKDTIYYNLSEDNQMLAPFKEKGIDVLIANNYIDSPLINFLESKHQPMKFQRVDGGLSDIFLDESREKTLLDADGRSESIKIAERFKSLLGQDTIEVEAKSLSSDQIPGFVVFDESARRMRDVLSLSRQELPEQLLGKPKWVLNTNHSLIETILNLKSEDAELAKNLTHQLYEMSLLSQKELDAKEIPAFIQRGTKLLQTMMEKIALKSE